LPQRIPAPEYADLSASSDASFAIDILNSLSAHVAVVDSSGVIVTVNDAWKRFAATHRSVEPGAYVGANYLAVCDAATERGDSVAGKVGAAIRTVLCGRQDTFSLEYYCDSPDEKRWFVMRVTRLSHASPAAIVVAHEDITAQKRMERAWLDAELALRQALAREQLMARTDSLTGLYNRGHFLELALHECAVAERYGMPLTALLLDVDHFKQVNDTAGHPAGDEMLRRIAQIVLQSIRKPDIAARYGGEEFILLLPGNNTEQGVVVAERIRESVAADSIETPAGLLRTTLSGGIATFIGEEDTLEGLIRRADWALYRAKGSGRNRTVIYSPTAPGAGTPLGR
jgi:diguanylate cyclase (GGDEF)-like protein